jgi:membrane-bound serine protease (ClpP class)
MINLRRITLLVSIVLVLFSQLLWSENNQKFDDSTRVYKIYTFDIKEEIAPPIWHVTKKSFQSAKDTEVDLILIHMNTYGGMLETADSIRTIILESKIPVWVFIDNNAASAGALISIACDSIYMRPGANIGAATVVNQTGEALPDKYQSYMRGMMRATAETKGRDPRIAEGMVDPRIVIEGITDSGKVITFTTSEAMKFGYCEGSAESIDEVIKMAGVKNYQIIEHHITFLDKIIRWLINPFVSGILIMIIIGGIYFELQTPGLGFPILAAITAALLYFAPLYLEGLAENWEIIIFIIGLILLAVELFVIPGFGVAGILGIVFIVAGLALSLVDNVGFEFSPAALGKLIRALFTVIIASFVSIVASIYFSRKLFGSTRFGELALTAVQEKNDGFTSAIDAYTAMIGQEGVAKTVLRPAGKILIDGETYDATAESGFIEKDEKIRVIRYVNTQLFVRKTT